jgi:hypothetical protein
MCWYVFIIILFIYLFSKQNPNCIELIQEQTNKQTDHRENILCSMINDRYNIYI